MTPFRARALGIPRVARGDGTMCASSAHPRSYFILAILCCRCSQPERRQHKTCLHLAILCVRIACRRDALLAGAWRQCALCQRKPPGLGTSSARKGPQGPRQCQASKSGLPTCFSRPARSSACPFRAPAAHFPAPAPPSFLCSAHAEMSSL